MNWLERFAAIEIQPGDKIIHIVERRYLEGVPSWRYSSIKTYCGIELPASFEECHEEAVNCQDCVAAAEKQQIFWKTFWAGAEGKRIYRILMGSEQREKEWRERTRQTEEFIRNIETFNKLLKNCLKYHQPVFTLELPDEILLKLIDYGSVGEVLLGFKLNNGSRQNLQETLGKAGFALLGSRLISKGLLKADDPIFNRRWE